MTYVSFSKEFDEFGTPTVPQSGFATSNEETPATLRFHVAVNDLGEIRYCFPINSSGDPALDEQERLQVVRSRFSPRRQSDNKPDSSLVWGVATIQWGSYVKSPQPGPVATGTP